MNCKEFESIILDLARRQLLDAAVRQQALGHTADCPRCNARLTDEQTLSAGFGAVREHMLADCAPPAIEATLLGAFRQHQAELSVAEPARVIPGKFSLTRAALVAAAVLVAIFT